MVIKSKHLLVSFLCLMVAIVAAQDSLKIDSLKKQLANFRRLQSELGTGKTSLKDSVEVFLLIQLSKENWGGDPEQARDFAQQALDLSERIDFPKGVATAYHCLGTAQEDLGNYPKALEYYEQSLKIRKERNDKLGISASYNNMGIIYYHQGNFPKALNSFLAALRIEEEIGDIGGIANSNLNVGCILVEQENYERALYHFNLATKLFEQAGEKEGVALTTNNIGAVYQALHQYEKAITLFEASLKVENELGNKRGAAKSLTNLGESYQKLNKNAEAFKYFNASLKLKEEMEDPKGISNLNAAIGMLYSHMGQPEKALPHIQRAQKIAQEIGASDLLKNIYEDLAIVHAQLGNYKDAYKYEVLYKQQFDSLFNTENEEKITELRMQYEFDKKEAFTKAQQEKKDKLNEAALIAHKRERTLYIILGLILFVAVLTLGSRLNYARKTRKILEEKNRQIDKEKEIANQQRIKAELLDMRHNIAKDLHDDIGSSLSSISIYSDVAGKITAELSPEATKILNSVGEIAQDAMENMSDIVWAINPVNDKLDDIVQRLMTIANQLQQVSGITVHFNIPENIKQVGLTMHQRKNFYLIFKEALNNIAKYSQAKNCFVEILKKNGQITVSIKDDGRGFVQKGNELGGNGLINMNKRAREMNGSFEVISEQGKGTELIFSFSEYLASV